jgi:peroxiredoxin
MNTNRLRQLASLAFALFLTLATKAAVSPKIGDVAPGFSLKTLDGRPAQLSKLTPKAPIVLVVLRGWPGYDCPLCTLQVHDFVANAAKLRAAGAQVVMIYPGPATDLKAHAGEFLQDKNWPGDFLFVLDPDYALTTAYGLRWDAPNETAYPSTFVINKQGRVTFAHVSTQHGDRVAAASVLEELQTAK